MNSATPQDGFVAMAEVVKAVGLKGELKLYTLLDFHAPILDSGYAVWEDGTPLAVSGHRPAGNCEVVRLDGCSSRDQADGLIGRRVGFLRADYPKADFPRPDAGLPFRWLGRPLVTAAGETVGEVDEVRWTGGQYLLVMKSGSGEVLIPAVAPILAFDPGLEGELVIDPPLGLLDVQGG